MNIPFFSGKKRKLFKDFLSAAYNVHNYRRDLMPQADDRRMHELIMKVEELFDDGKSDTPEFESAKEELEKLMKKYGGTIYPLTSLADNVDVIVVAGILALSVRSFFFQPFQIPTNSMYPSFYGMTPQVYTQSEDAPNFAERLFRLVTKKASNYNLKAPSDGEVFIRINHPSEMSRNGGIFHGETRPARWLLVLPTREKAYTFMQNGKTFELGLPADFSIDSVMPKAYPFGSQSPSSSDYFKAINDRAKIVQKGGEYYLSLGNKKAGESILNFDILGGDMLFVDRFTYNFRKPKIGEPFVFRTGECAGLTALNHGVPDDKYYIKRLVGEGGDELQIKDSTLYRNGKPIEGSAAFKQNANREGDYCGYKAEGALKNGRSAKVAPHSYYAMGDNSANSLDSRYWGDVPEKSVVGRALVIFYPFTERWGAAK